MAFLYETHMHTSQASACAINTGEEQVQSYSRLGYTGVIVTDHFINGNTAVPRYLPWVERMDMMIAGYWAAKAEGERCGLDVFFGWEYYIGGLEFLTYGLDYEFILTHPEMERMNIQEYSNLVRGNGGYLAQAHPFRDRAYIRNPWAVDAEYLDGVEVYNAANRDNENERAMAYALEHNLPMQAGSDSHWVNLRRPSGIILRKRAETIFDIINVVKNGEAELVMP